MTDEQLAENAKGLINEIGNRLEQIDYEWKFNVKTLIAMLRGYAAKLEKAKENTDEFEIYGHAIDCKNSVLDSYNALHDLYHEKQCLKKILELLNKEEKKDD